MYKTTLTVIDFQYREVYQYFITTDKQLRHNDFEEIIIYQGHKLDKCEFIPHINEVNELEMNWFENKHYKIKQI